MERKKKLRKIMKEKKIDLILAYSDLYNFSYSIALLGEKPTLFHYYFLTENEEGILELDFLVEKKFINGRKIIPLSEQNPDKTIKNFIEEKYKRVGILGNAPFWHLKQINCEIINLNKEGDFILQIKNKEEIEKIAISAKTTMKILQKTHLSFKGKKEKEIEKKLFKEIMQKSEGLAFPTSVKKWNFKNEKEIIEIDMGVIKNNFYSDITRMYFINFPEGEKNYKKLIHAHKRVISKIKPGLKLNRLVSLYKEEIEKEKLPSNKLGTEDLGHSIGFFIHENPIFYLEEQKDFELKKNMIITLEPWIDMGKYQIRVEDMILISKNSKILTEL